MFDKQTIDAVRNAKNILIVKLRYIGDSIWMLPFVDNLKQNLPDARITVLVNEGTEAFFINRPTVDSLIVLPRRKMKGKLSGFFRALSFLSYVRGLRPDVVIELTDNDRAAIISYFSGAKIRISYNNENKWRRKLYTHFCSTKIFTKHMVDYNLDILREFGIQIYDSSIKINVPPDAVNSLKIKCPSVFETVPGKKKIVIHPGSRTPLRQWGIRNFAYVNDALSNKYRVFLVAGPQEKGLLSEVYRAARIKPEICTSELNLYEFAALCGVSDMFIGNDSGPIHIASAKTFTVGIYGPTVSNIVAPWTDRKFIFEGSKLYCRPCRQDKCINDKFKACLDEIKPDNVAEKVLEMLSAV
jgi:ADP-heptose:LPS heptosyltransferase